MLLRRVNTGFYPSFEVVGYFPGFAFCTQLARDKCRQAASGGNAGGEHGHVCETEWAHGVSLYWTEADRDWEDSACDFMRDSMCNQPVETPLR